MNDPFLWRSFQGYANNDNFLNRAIFLNLISEFPPVERRVMDRVLRCAVEPRFHVDTQMLRGHLDDLETERAEILIEAGAPTTMDDPQRELALEKFAQTLRSNDQFTKVLQDRGVEVVLKQSLTDPTRMIPAFAKTDEFMADLQNNEDPDIQALACARLGLRSTIERTRGEKILSIASLPWAKYRARYMGGTMPIPLRYSGAHTHRLSGEWKINMQNLPAGRGKRKSKLRKALVAPPGCQVLVADLSQIECRIAAWLCGETDLIDQFATKKDPYSILASKIFGFIVDKKIHLLERFIGKSGVLGLGFGCGADKFFNMVLRAARGMGMDMGPLLAVWTPGLAQKSVNTYRQANSHIRDAWGQLDTILNTSWCGATAPVCWGPATPAFPTGVVEIGHGYVLLPNGMKMVYDVVPAEGGEWRYRYGRKTPKIYGAKFLENIVQALARIVVMDAALRLWSLGYKFALQAHDELAFIVRTEDAENAKAVVLAEMCRRPIWAPDLPLDAEANFGPSYGDAK
jgi:DNA polymerase